MNLLPADGPLPVPGASRDAAHQVGVRPELVRLGAPDGVAATVQRVEVVGEDTYVYLTLGGHEIVARVPTDDRPEPGDAVTVAARPADVHVFDVATGRRVAGS
jgi:ABC-type sugar transport system ATPase subunit